MVSQLRNLDRSIEILEQKLQKYTGITGAVKSSEKRKMISEKEALQDQRSVLSKQLGIIVRDAGYQDTRNFMDAYHRCEDTVREYHELLETHPEEKKIAMESALDRLHRYQEQAKFQRLILKDIMNEMFRNGKYGVMICGIAGLLSRFLYGFVTFNRSQLYY